MKLFIVLIVALFGIVYAQEQRKHGELARTLVERAQKLHKRIMTDLEQHRLKGNEHLLQALKQESHLVESLVKDLETRQKNEKHEWSLSHLHKIEEQLLFHENRVSEELEILENHKDQPMKHDNAEKLIGRAQELLRKAQDLLERHQVKGHQEVDAIRQEVEEINKLVTQIKSHPSGHDLKQDEEQLARHERSLAKLIERIEN